nr:folate receptor alpha-like [Procambarus clarkii]
MMAAFRHTPLTFVRWLNMTGDCPTKGSCLTNYCPVNSTCQTFKEIYRTARNFCEKVWDNAWKYAEPTTPCMHLQFNQSAINPNDAVALHYAQIIAGSQMHSCNLMWFSIQLAVWAFINRILSCILDLACCHSSLINSLLLTINLPLLRGNDSIKMFTKKKKNSV